MAAGSGYRRRLGRLAIVGAVGMALVLATSAVVSAALVGGSLPGGAFTYLSTTQNAVNMAGDAVRLKIKDEVTVKTTYSIVTPTNQIVGGWHYHNGPVIVTVAVGTLTFYDANCNTWDVSAGESFIESTGQVLNAKALTSKNAGTLEWFTTRLYPGPTDPVFVDAPCAL
jgi:quercetin dioxygenase-like cupin family protein